MKVWNVADGELQLSWEADTRCVTSIIFLTSALLLTSGGEGLVKIWNIQERNGDSPLLLRSLKHHSGWINCMALAPSGDWLASGGNDMKVKLWDLRATTAEGEELITTLSGHEGEVWSLVVAADGKALMSADDGGIVKVWDLGEEASSKVEEEENSAWIRIELHHPLRRKIFPF